MKVLMVDDEELTREGLRMSIPWESLGISQIFMAEDGEEGLRMALELKPDIILAMCACREWMGLPWHLKSGKH